MLLSSTSCNCSVIVAVFNGADFLAASLDSISKQNVLPRQVIIVDDGSTDSSANLIDSFKKQHESTFEVLTIAQENKGQSSARNLGISHAKYEFIAFLDQDDLWEKDHLDVLINGGLFKSKTGWVYSDFDLIDKTGNVLVPNKLRSSGYIPPQQSIQSMLSMDLMMLPTASVVRLEAIREVAGFDTQFRGFEDDDLFVRILISGYSFAFVDQSTIKYRVHETNSSGGITFAQSRMKFFYKYLEYLNEQPSENQNITRDYLAPRITSGILHDLFVAIREKNQVAEDFALNNLNVLIRFRGKTFKRKGILLVAKIKPLYNILYRAYLKRANYLELRRKRQSLRDTH